MEPTTVTITVGYVDAEIIFPELVTGRRPWARHGIRAQRRGRDVEVSGTPGAWRKRLRELADDGEHELLNNLVPLLDSAGTRWAAMLDGEVNLTGTLVEVRERVAYLDAHCPGRDVYVAAIEPHFGDGLARG